MKTSKVIVLPYDKAWQTSFEKIKEDIQNVLGALATMNDGASPLLKKAQKSV